MSSAALEVQQLCPELSLADIEADLRVSGSADATVNRVFDGLFLVHFSKKANQGTPKDPSLALVAAAFRPAPSSLSDDDDIIIDLSAASSSRHPASPPPRHPAPRPPQSLSAAIEILDSSDDDQPQHPSSSFPKSSFNPRFEALPPAPVRTNNNNANKWKSDIDQELQEFASSEDELISPRPSIPVRKIHSAAKESGRWKSDLDRELADLASSDDEFSSKPKASSSSSLSVPPPQKKRVVVGLSHSWLDEYSISDREGDDENGTAKSKKSSSSTSTSSNRKSSSKKKDSVLTTLMNKKYNLSEDSESDLDSRDGSRGSEKKRRAGAGSSDDDNSQLSNSKRVKKSAKRSDSSSDEEDEALTKKRKPKCTSLDKEAKELEKIRKAEEKERIKLQKAEKKRIEKEQKDRERELKKLEKEEAKKSKSETTAANKLRTKQISATEMTLHLDPTFITTLPGGAKILDAVQEAGCRISMTPQPIPTALQWTRTVTRVWNAEREVWVPCESRIEKEPYVLVRVAASEFSKVVLVGEVVGVSSYLENVRRLYGREVKPVIFLEGVKDLIKHRTRSMNSMIQKDVRMMGGGSGGRAPRTAERVASKEDIDAALLWMQMCGDCFVQQSEGMEETCSLISSFTTSIAMIPERRSRSEQQLKLNFGDTVKSGTSTQDCWRRILMEIKPLAESVANTILTQYPTYRSLMDTYRRLAHAPKACEELIMDL
ncbi:putative monocarboxylate transporter mch1, partial [Podochytrium sp. JEL0797]